MTDRCCIIGSCALADLKTTYIYIYILMCVYDMQVCVCVCDDGQSHFPFGKTTQKHAWAALTSMLDTGKMA